MPRTFLSCIAAALLCTAAVPAPPAQDAGKTDLQRVPPKVLPLANILAEARRIAPGKVIDVELEYDEELDDDHPDTRWVYEVEVLTMDNRVIELEFDAETGRLLEIEGAPWPPDVPKPAR
jgi:uncharacterized membrane protein YkoI